MRANGTTSNQASRRGIVIFVGGCFLLVCIVATTALVLQHFGSVQLPGCGMESSCAAALGSLWGNIAGWPLSFIGLAYFVGLAAAVCCQGAGISFAVRLGALVSIAFLVIIAVGRYNCAYCIAVHVSNLFFWIFVECSRRPTGSSISASMTFCAVFALVSALLNVAVSEQKRLAKESTFADIQRSIDRKTSRDLPTASDTIKATMSKSTTGSQVDSPHVGETDSQATALDKDTVAGVGVSDVGQPEQQKTQRPYRLGAEQAAVGLVVFIDYQCEDSRRLLHKMQTLFDGNKAGMSVTARHYPSCRDCNFLLDVTTHPNACKAAQAAEAAGTLKGTAGFWEMHRWLIERKGDFTEEDLRQAVTKFGHNAERFLETMNSQEVMGAILTDIVEARTFAVKNTPAVVLNGAVLPVDQAEIEMVRAVMATADQSASGDHQNALVTSNRPIDRALAENASHQLQISALLATVRIVNEEQDSVGSGAIVAVREPFVYVLTASHLVPRSDRVDVQTFSEQSYPQPAGVYPRAKVIAKSAQADLAVVRFSTSDPMPQPLKIAFPDLVPSEKGFPVVTVGCSGQESPTSIANEVLQQKRVRRRTGGPVTTVWEVRHESAKGRSGGPLIDLQGNLLGIASGASRGRGYFCHTQEIHTFLAKNGLQWLYSDIDH